MYTRKFIRGLMIPTFGVGVVHAKGEQEKEECDDTKKLIRARDLPLYVEPPKCVTCSNTIENDDGFLITTIRCARQEFQAIIGQAKVVQNEVQNIVDGVQKETADVVDYLRQEENLLPRFGAIGLGGFAGYLLAIRKGIIKKAMYSAAGAGLIAAVAYPNQAKEYTEEVMCEVKKYAVIGYHFLNGADVDWEKLEGIKAPCFVRKEGNAPQDTSSGKPLPEKSESYKAEDGGEKGIGANGQSENMVEGTNEQSEKKLEGANEQSENKLEGANIGQAERMMEGSATPDDPCKEYLEKQKARALRDPGDNNAKRRAFGDNKIKRSYSEMCREKGACAPKRKKENIDAAKICDSDCSGGRRSKRRGGDIASGSQSPQGNGGQMKGADESQGYAANGQSVSDNNAPNPQQQLETQKPDWLPRPYNEPQQEIQRPTRGTSAPPCPFTICPPTPPSRPRKQQSETQNSPGGGNSVQINGAGNPMPDSRGPQSAPSKSVQRTDGAQRADSPGRQNTPISGCQKKRKGANDFQSSAEKQGKNEEDRVKIFSGPREQDSGMHSVVTQPCKPGGQESEKQTKTEEDREKISTGPRAIEQESGMDNIDGHANWTQSCNPGGQPSESFKPIKGTDDPTPPPADRSSRPAICPPGCVPEGRMQEEGNSTTVMQTSNVNFGKTGDWGNSPIKGEPFVPSDPRRSPIKKSSVIISYPSAPGSADSQVILPEKVGSIQPKSRLQATRPRSPCHDKSMKPPANEP